MNMLIRFMLMLFSISRNQKSAPTNSAVLSQDTSDNQQLLQFQFERCYRVMLHDLGFRDHLPQYRFLSFVELNTTGWVRQFLCDDYQWVMAAQQVSYIKMIKPFQKFCLRTQSIGWDEKYLYLRHEFVHNDQIHAVSLSKIVLFSKNNKVSVTQTLGLAKYIPEQVTTWLHNQESIKRNANRG